MLRFVLQSKRDSGPNCSGGFWSSLATPEEFIPLNCGQLTVCASEVKGSKKKLHPPKRNAMPIFFIVQVNKLKF